MKNEQSIALYIIIVGILTLLGIFMIWFGRLPTSDDFKVSLISQLISPSDTKDTGAIPSNKSAAFISALEGGVRLKKKNGGESLLLPNTPIETGDSISTDANARVEIFFANNSFIRLAENSNISLTDTSTIEFISGKLWARILEIPKGNPPFNIVVNDIETTVQDATVYIKGSTTENEIQVIDSSNTGDEIATVTYNSGSGSVMENIRPNESLLFTLNTKETSKQILKSKKLKLNMDRVLQDDFARYNLKSDIILLNTLATKGKPLENPPLELASIGKTETLKIESEFTESLPKKSELERFFTSSAIAKEAGQLPIISGAFSGGIHPLTKETQIGLIVNFISEDIGFENLRKELSKKRSTAEGFTSEQEKLEFQKQVNALEQNLHEFNNNWMRLEKERMEQLRTNSSPRVTPSIFSDSTPSE